MWVSSAPRRRAWVIHLRQTRSSMTGRRHRAGGGSGWSLRIHIELGWYVAQSGRGRRLEPDCRGGRPVAQVMVVQHSADCGGPGPQAARP